MKKKLALLFIALFGIATVQAQSCKDEYSYCDRGQDKNFQVSNQSKSGTFGRGEEHELSLILYDGIAYRISLCANEPDLEGKLEFEIYTMTTEKRFDKRKNRMAYVKVPQVIYSNREDNMAQAIEFQADGTKKIYVKVFVPEGASEGGKRSKLAASNVVCVGVLLQHQKGTDTGFH